MKDPDVVESKLNAFIRAGQPRLQLIADFDYTITKQHFENGITPESSYSFLGKCPSVPENKRIQISAIEDIARTFKIDPQMTIEQVQQTIINLWTNASYSLT